MKTRRVLLGVAGVDSGQLLVCDPCYIGSQWSDDDDDAPGANNLREVMKDIVNGSLWQCTAMEIGVRRPDIHPFLTWGDPLVAYDGLTPNQLRKSGRWTVEKLPPPPCHRRFSYGGCCEASMLNPNGGGQLDFPMGHDGAGVCFRSGFGDGNYEVWANVLDNPLNPGEVLITSVEIVLVTEQEAMEEIKRISQEGRQNAEV